MMPFRLLPVLFFVNIALIDILPAQPISSHQWGNWKTWGDSRNGMYANPILPADFSDVDCIRVGADYYAISSTFQYAPGMVILKSRDLVNWKIIGHAVTDLNQISPEMNWDRMNRYGTGIWAGAIRYHHKKFWIYFGTPDEGYFMTTAKKPEGPWEPVHAVLKQAGWDDCAPFWDDDGQGYLIGTHFKDNYKIHLFKLTADGRELVSGSDQVIHQSEGSEANKLYKINGYYYHFFSEVKPEGRVVMMQRSKNIYGPYNEVRQLNHAQKNFNEPNQGAILQTQKGDWYFLTHHGSGDWSGRVLSLLPVTWINGWPVPGAVGKDKIGTMAWSGKMPVAGQGNGYSLQSSDEFNGSSFLPQWEWNYQPRVGKWSLAERPGWLRLHAFRPLVANDLLRAGNTLTQRSIRTKANTVIIKMDLSGMANGQSAGLSHFGNPDYAAFGVSCENSIKKICFNERGSIKKGPVINGNLIWLKSTWGLDGNSCFYYSKDGKVYRPFGPGYQLAWGSYRGDRIAIYCYNDIADKGFVDIDFFKYDYKK